MYYRSQNISCNNLHYSIVIPSKAKNMFEDIEVYGLEKTASWSKEIKSNQLGIKMVD